MDENPYQAPEPAATIPSIAPRKVSLLRQVVSALLLAIGLLFTIVILLGIVSLADPEPGVRMKSRLLIESGLIAVVCFVAAYRVQRPRPAEPR